MIPPHDKSISEHLQAGGPSRKHKALRRRRHVWKALRVVSATAMVLMLVMAMGLGALYFLFQGEANEDSVLHTQLENSIREALGEDINVEIGKTHLDFGKSGLLSVATEDLLISTANDDVPIASIGAISVGAKIIPTLRGSPSFSDVVLEDVVVDGRLLGGGKTETLQLQPVLDQVGQQLASLSARIWGGQFDSITMRNTQIVRANLGRRSGENLVLPELKIVKGRGRQIDLSTRIETDLSSVDFVGRYQPAQGQGNQFVFNLSGIDMREWLPGPDGKRITVGTDARITILANFPFDKEGRSQQPLIAIESGDSQLNLANQVAVLSGLRVNLRLLPLANAIEIERSVFRLGDLQASFIGSIKPQDVKVGLVGPLDFTLNSEQAVFRPTRQGEDTIAFSLVSSGLIDLPNMELRVEEATISADDGEVRGSGVVGLADASPPLKLEANTDGISVVAVKQMWPMFMGNNTREWMHKHIYDGQIVSGTASLDVPAGILGHIQDGERFAPEHIKIGVKIENGKFQPFGELPVIENATADVSLVGMRVSAKVTNGKAIGSNGGAANVEQFDFALADFGEIPGAASTSVKVSGGAKTLAAIAAAQPLNVMERINIDGSGLQGQAKVDVSASFPLARKLKAEQVDWKADLALRDFATDVPIEGRVFKNADLDIEVNESRALIRGTALVDGLQAKLDLVEPVGKSSRVKAKRIITAVLDEDARKRAGIDLGPVLSGVISAKFEQTGEGPQNQSLDLTNAELNLPWINWRKGSKVPASATFVLLKDGDTTTLKDFSIKGPDFGAAGTVVLGKNGIISVRLNRAALNEGDSFAVSVDRDGSLFKVAVEGKSIDARSLINTIIHDGSFKKGQGSASVDVTANVAKVVGFQGQSIFNAFARYSTRNGLLRSMELKGVSADGRLMAVRSNTEGDQNTFNITSSDAGHSLRFVNIYKHMRGGALNSRLVRQGNGPYVGSFRVEDFTLIDEPKLKRLVTTTKRSVQTERGVIAFEKIDEIEENKVRFNLAEARLDKGDGYLKVQDGLMRNSQIGFTFEGTVYDNRDRMKIAGTFMPAFAISSLVSSIPIVGQILGGRDSGLIGITYRLRGDLKKPTLDINPMSIVAPGIFNRVFEFRN